MSTVWIGPLVIKELKRIVEASEITKYASSYKPWLDAKLFSSRKTIRKRDIVKKQELEIRIGNDHIAFEVSILTNRLVYSSTHWYILYKDCQNWLPGAWSICEDPEGLRVFYYLVQDLKVGVFHHLSRFINCRSFSAWISPCTSRPNLYKVGFNFMCRTAESGRKRFWIPVSWRVGDKNYFCDFFMASS